MNTTFSLNIESVLRQYARVFPHFDHPELHILIDTCSLQHFEHEQYGKIRIDTSRKDHADYRLLISEGVLEEIERLPDLQELPVTQQVFERAARIDPHVCDDNKYLIRQGAAIARAYSLHSNIRRSLALPSKNASVPIRASEYAMLLSCAPNAIQQAMLEKHDIPYHMFPLAPLDVNGLRWDDDMLGKDMLISAPSLAESTRDIPTQKDELAALVEYANRRARSSFFKSYGIKYNYPSPQDTELLSYGLHRAREKLPTVIISDDFDVWGTNNVLRKRTNLADFNVSDYLMAFPIRYLVGQRDGEHLRKAA